jgi:competence protein ComGE
MLKNCKGYTLLEMLVAFSLLFLLLTHALPLYIHIKQERKNVEMDKSAVKLLHQAILAYKYDGLSPDSSTNTQQGTVYEIDWNEGVSGFLEACISWENQTKRRQKRCDYIRK